MVRFGIAGTGRDAERFYQANKFTGGFELTAVYAKDMEEANIFCWQKGQPDCFDDFDAFAESDQIDAVYISGPVSEHYQQAATLLRAGKHVLCRSPLAWNEEEAKELFEIARGQNVILLEAMASVYTPGFQKMITHIHNMGTIRRATFGLCKCDQDYNYYKRGIAQGLFDPELTGGAKMELACVPAACMVYLFGEPEDVKGFSVRFDSGVEATGSIVLKYDGMIGEIQYSAVSNPGVPSQIQGEEASMLIREIDNVKDLRIFRGTVKQTIHFEQSDSIMNHVTNAFMKMIETGSGHEKAAENTLAVLRILNQI